MATRYVWEKFNTIKALSEVSNKQMSVSGTLIDDSIADHEYTGILNVKTKSSFADSNDLDVIRTRMQNFVNGAISGTQSSFGVTSTGDGYFSGGNSPYACFTDDNNKSIIPTSGTGWYKVMITSNGRPAPISWIGGTTTGSNVTATFSTNLLVFEMADSKGSTSYGNVSSSKASTYPSNGISGSNWYVSKGSDNIDPVSLTYTDPVDAGAEIGLTITPSAGTTLGGTITYTIQTTVNGEDWYDAGTTTATTFTVTVPQDAVIWNVRVFAKDDTGFTSDTYVYGNGVDTWVTVNHIGFAPDSGSLGYLTSKNLLAVSVSHDSETTYSLEAKLDETSVFTKADCSTTTAVMITLTDEQWQAVTEEDEHTLDVTATFTSGAQTKNYTFKKFTYDDTSLAGVMAGTAKAIRIKRDYATQILGRNFPKEIIKVDNPINTNALKASTASEAQVFSGYTFFSGDSELRTGIAMSQETNVTADNIPAGITAYNKDGQFISGNGSGVFKYQKVSFYTSDNDEAGKTYTYNTDFKIYAVAFDSSNTNYGCATVTDYVGTSSLGKGIIVGDKTQMAVGYLMSGQGAIVWVITKVSDTQVTARCLGAGINGAGSTTIDLYIIGG